jgi:hypothetical protein
MYGCVHFPVIARLGSEIEESLLTHSHNRYIITQKEITELGYLIDRKFLKNSKQA